MSRMLGSGWFSVYADCVRMYAFCVNWVFMGLGWGEWAIIGDLACLFTQYV
jgi:hypothetical protein